MHKPTNRGQYSLHVHLFPSALPSFDTYVKFAIHCRRLRSRFRSYLRYSQGWIMEMSSWLAFRHTFFVDFSRLWTRIHSLSTSCVLRIASLTLYPVPPHGFVSGLRALSKWPSICIAKIDIKT